jgi:hypothetical protein
MAEDPNQQQNKANAAHQRRSAALRANLKRRKQQAKDQAKARSTDSGPDQASDRGSAPLEAVPDRKEP